MQNIVTYSYFIIYLLNEMNCKKIIKCKAENCLQLQCYGRHTLCNHLLHVDYKEKAVEINCDFKHQGGAWMLIYRRSNGAVDFTDKPSSKDYVQGFGEATQDFYLGHDHVAHLTSNKLISTDLHIEYRLRSIDTIYYLRYTGFSLASAKDHYRIKVENFVITASHHYVTDRLCRDCQFYDRDYDLTARQCVSTHGPGWYSKTGNCDSPHFFGVYRSPPSGKLSRPVLTWLPNLNSSEMRRIDYMTMQIRPSNYKQYLAEQRCNNVCTNGAICIDDFCKCRTGFMNPTCSLPLKIKDDVCKSNPCQHGSTCTLHLTYNKIISGFRCKCMSGFGGILCEARSNCVNHTCNPIQGTCVPEVRGEKYTCACAKGSGGITCDVRSKCRIDSCPSNKECITDRNHFYCRERNNCMFVDCLNEGTCVEGATDAICVCTHLFVGKYCQYDICDTTLICRNQGTCLPSNTLHGAKCICSHEYYGDECENTYESCHNYPCLHNGTCENYQDKLDYQCKCVHPYFGKNCHQSFHPNLKIISYVNSIYICTLIVLLVSLFFTLIFNAFWLITKELLEIKELIPGETGKEKKHIPRLNRMQEKSNYSNEFISEILE